MTPIASTGASTTSRIACSSLKASVLKSGATALLSIAALLLSATSAQAVTYYWDEDQATAGFGSAAGTWENPTVDKWSLDAAGTAAAGPSITTADGDLLYFGTDTVALGTGTISITGTVAAKELLFGKASGSITLGAVDTDAIISLGASPKIYAASGGGSTLSTHTINANLTSSAALTIGQQGTANESYIINGDISGTFGLQMKVQNNTAYIALDGDNSGYNGNIGLVTGSLKFDQNLGSGAQLTLAGNGGQQNHVWYSGSVAYDMGRNLKLQQGNTVLTSPLAPLTIGDIQANDGNGATVSPLRLTGSAGGAPNYNVVAGTISGAGGDPLNLTVTSVQPNIPGSPLSDGRWKLAGTGSAFTGNVQVDVNNVLEITGDVAVTGKLFGAGTYNINGGSLSLIASASQTITNGGIINISNGGTFITTNTGATWPQVTLNIIGSGNTVQGSSWNYAGASNQGSVNFIADAAGVSPVVMTAGTFQCGRTSDDKRCTVSADGTNYEGGTADFTLVQGSITNLDTLDTAVTGFDPLVYTASITATASGIVLQVTDLRQQDLVWSGAGDSSWAVDDSSNWTGGDYDDIDSVSFGDAGAGTVTVSGVVAPVSILVDSANDYTFTGAAISPVSTFTKAGTGALTLQNTVTGEITLNGGTLEIGSSTTFSEGVVMAAGSTLTVSGNYDDSANSNVTALDNTGATVNIETGGTIDLTDLDTSGGTFVPFGDGTVNLNGGSFVSDEGVNGNDAISYRGTINFNSGSFSVPKAQGFASGDPTWNIIGSSSTIAIGILNCNNVGRELTINFNLDATGVSPIAASNYMRIGVVDIVVDGTNYTGTSSTTIDLITSAGSGAVEPNSITIVPNSFGDLTSAVALDGNNLVLTLTAPPPAGAATWTSLVSGDWQDGVSTNWDATYTNGFPAIFGNTAATGDTVVTLVGSITPSSVVVDSANDYTFTGAALGADGTTGTTLTKSDTGTLTLNSANTYTGATTVDGGVLAISDGTSLGTDAAGTTVTSGAQLAIDGGITVAEPLTIAGSGQSNNGGLKTVGVANNTISGAIGVTGARIRADGSSPLALTGGITGDTLILTGAVTVSTTPIVLSGTLNIAGDDVATSYNANGGTDVAFNLGNVTQLNVAGNSAATTNLFFDAQVQLGVEDALATTTNLSFLSYGADVSTYTTKLDLKGFNQTVASLSSTQNPSSLVPQGVNMSITSTAGTGTLTVDQATDTTYSGRFDGTMNLVKAGVGTLTLDNRSSAAHSISGTTTVSAGILDIDTDYTSAITVAATGSLEVDLGTTLTLQGALSVDAASEIVIDGTPTLDSYTLISAASIAGSPVLSATITNYVLEVIGNELQLNFNPAVWSGSGNSVWADGDATNWSFTYNNGAPVSFTDTGAGTVTVSTALTPLSVLVDSTADYTFTGAGSITAPFTKQGAGNLTIDTTLNSSAAITFNGGTTTITGAVESSISGGGNMTQGDGAMIIDGGTFSMITDGAAQTLLEMDNDITLRNGGTITSNARFGMATGTTLVIEGGSGAAVTAANSIQLSPSAATYRYEFDATGVAYLQAGSYAALDGASFEVDLTNFAGWGSAATFPLVNTGNVAGVPAGASSPVEAPAGFTITAPGKTYGVDYTINVSSTTNVCEVAILEVATNDVASWAATFTASDAAFTGSPATDPLTDYDNDGLSNLLEYVLGGSPIANQDTAVPTVSQDATYMIFTYNRSDISTATGNDVTIVAEYAADLSGSWTAAVNGTASVVIEENTSADPDVVTVKVPLAGTEQFIRLNVDGGE
jgi:fibronectin-binding autotransporter adhesin